MGLIKDIGDTLYRTYKQDVKEGLTTWEELRDFGKIPYLPRERRARPQREARIAEYEALRAAHKSGKSASKRKGK